MKRALILGVSGQDGQFLADYLLKCGYIVLGASRNHPFWEVNNLQLQRPKFHQLDVTNIDELRETISSFKPDEIFNLSGESSVARSFSEPKRTLKTNTIGLINILDVIVELNMHSDVKVFQASSSEMFGSSEFMLNENSPLLPTSPYGMSKSLSHRICSEYRDEFGIWIATGILFNHESQIHDARFVFQKIIRSLVEIRLGSKQFIELGNVDIARDWGYAKEYVVAMHSTLQTSKPGDYVLATGVVHSLTELISSTSEFLGLNQSIQSLMKSDASLIRPTDIKCSWGDPSRAERELGWRATTNFQQLIEIVTKFHLSAHS